MMKESPLKVFCGNSNPALAKEICEYLKVPLEGRCRQLSRW